MDKTETNDLLEECMLYFKARPVYKKLFLKMRDKYAGLGHFGGTAMLTSLSREEKSQLGGFFQRDYTSNKTITISADLMKKCLESSKFAGLTWELILETYFGEPLQVKKEIELAGYQTPKTGDTKDGMVYVEGFGWITDEGEGSGTYADDMYENGNKIGIMD